MTVQIDRIKEFCPGLRKMKHRSCTFAALRYMLRPKVISRELRVKDAEKFIGRSAV